ncbi:MAG: rhomboid family intramembrane serine protease [candidate division Zixibacteria bacterium]|nr:rhomboid family intramembrane serine protease [candidate division Zixibacteria bacterium]
MNVYRSYFAGRGGMVPPVVKMLLISNAVVFILTYFSPIVISKYFGLVPQATWSQFMIWQPVTYLFLHGGFWHIAMNMFILWMFGSDLERTWGSKEFLKYYLICGIGAGLFNVVLQPNSLIPIIGASGAIYGILIGFAILFPNRLIYIYFLFPVKAKYLVMFLVGVAFFMSMVGTGDNIAHIVHLGGALIGFLYLRGNWQGRSIKQKISGYFHRQRMEKMARQHEKELKMMEEVDRILDKINQVGYDNLTRHEKKILEDASDQLSKK